MADYRLNQPGATIQDAIDIALEIQGDLADEIAAREAADALLATKTELQSEANVRQAADAEKASLTQLANETNRAQAAESALGDRIDAIGAKIPSEASSSNQLADKNFVNSSIGTSTANYISNNGEPFTSVAQLNAYTGPHDNNDYAFVVSTDAAGNTVYSRYKYNGSTWAKEYDLNNSSFTAAQWAAINSLMTAAKTQKLDALPTASELTTLFSGKQDVIADLATIRAQAAAAYVKPSGGIPASDIADGVIPDISGKVNTSDIADNLITNDATKVLSAKQGKVLSEQVTQLGQEVAENGAYYLPWSDIKSFKYALSSDGKFIETTQTLKNSHKVIPVSAGQILYIKRGTDNCYFGIVKSYTIPSVGDSADFADGESARYLSGTGTFNITIPAGAKFVIVCENFNGTNRSPSILKIGRYDVLLGINREQTIGTSRIEADAITEQKLANNSVTSGKIANNSVTSEKISDGSISEGKLAAGSVTASKLANGTITPEKTSFFVQSKNLFDWSKAVVGKYLGVTGVEIENANYSCSDFIPIDPTKSNVVSNAYAASGSFNCFYDINKDFISGSNFQGATSQIPQNAAYVRYSFPLYTTEQQLKTIQVEYGTTSSSYVPYSETIDPKFIPDVASKSNEIILPKALYLLSDVNNDVFYEPILRFWNPYRFDIYAATTPNGRNYVKAIKRVVTLNNPTATGLSLSLYDLNKDAFVQIKSVALRKGMQGAGNTEIKVGIIGDSYTDGGGFTPALLSHNYVPNLTLVGTRSVNDSTYINQKTDGRSGWTLATFFTVQTNADYFNPFYHPQGTHRYWGCTTFWANVCGGDPTGYGTRYTHYASLCDATGWPVSPSEGDVIYDSANTAFKEYQSGSWVTVQQTDYTWEFNYAKYLSMWNVDTPDILCVMLGVNDFWVNNEPTAENLAIWKTRMNTIITSFKASNANGKFVILTANTVTYPNALHYRPLDVHNRMQTLREFVINEWDDKESEGIYVVDTAQLIDSEHAFILTEATPFDGFSGTAKEVYAADGQHPRLNYTTLGYSLAAFIQYFRN